MYYSYIIIKVPHDTKIPEIDHETADAFLDGVVYDSDRGEWLWSGEIEDEDVADMDAKIVVNFEKLLKFAKVERLMEE